MNSAALFDEGKLAFEEVPEWLSVSTIHDCLTRTDGQYNPLLLGPVKGAGDLVASAMDFAPGVWLNPQLDPGNGLKSAFTGADSDGRAFPHTSNMEDSPISFEDVERSRYQDVWNESDYAGLSGLSNSNVFRRLKKGDVYS